MLENKIFEIRDRMTFIPALCTKMAPTIHTAEREEKLMRHSGYGFGVPMIILTMLNDTKRTSYNAFSWGDRTMHNAHLYINEHFNELETGAVVDVEYILGETDKPKTPEAI